MQGQRTVKENYLPNINLQGGNLISNNLIINTGTTGMIGWKGQHIKITENKIINSNRLRAQGAAKAGIKVIVQGIDVEISDNYFYNNIDTQAIWLDWASQGTKISGNFFVESRRIWIEAQHGPIIFNNNVFIETDVKITDGGGVVFAHNLFYKSNFKFAMPIPRIVQSYEPHTNIEVTKELGNVTNINFIANLFIKNGFTLPEEDSEIFNNAASFNAYYDGALPSPRFEVDATEITGISNYNYTATEDKVVINFIPRQRHTETPTPLITMI